VIGQDIRLHRIHGAQIHLDMLHEEPLEQVVLKETGKLVEENSNVHWGPIANRSIVAVVEQVVNRLLELKVFGEIHSKRFKQIYFVF